MIENKPYNLEELDRFAFGDKEFRKELIAIFIEQLPVFIPNMKLYFDRGEWDNLAREAHTAKSSVLIFGMHNTGKTLKEIQLLAESRITNDLTLLMESVISDMEIVFEHLKKEA